MFSLVVVGLCQDDVGTHQGEVKLEVERDAEPDSLLPIIPDSTAIVPPDTSIIIDKKDQPQGFFSSLIKPIVLTGLIGGILYMLFTERGR